MIRHKGLILLLAVAVLTRLFIIQFALNWRENPDILRWKDRSRIAVEHGFAAVYETDYLKFGTIPNTLPPGGEYILAGVYHSWLLAGKVLARLGIPPGSNMWVNGPFLTLLYRIPSLLSDVGIGVLLYIIAGYGRKSKRSGFVAASVFLFHPGVLFNSAYMGQRDSINNLFLLIGVFGLIRRQFIPAAIALALSLLIKLSVIYTVPVFIYMAYIDSPTVWIPIAAIGVAVLTTLIGVLPVSMNPIAWYTNFLLNNPTGEMANISASALNGWWAVFRPRVAFGPYTSTFDASITHIVGTPFVDERWMHVPIGIWAIGVFLIIVAPLLIEAIRLKKKLFEPRMLVLFLGMLSLLSYMWLPKMHARYMFPSFAFFALSIGYGAPILFECIAISLLDLINLLIIWHPSPLTFWQYSFLADRNTQWGISILLVLFTFVLYRRVIRLMQQS